MTQRSALVFAVVLSSALVGVAQTTALRVVAAGPAGELDRLEDADEVRVTFSEPMIAVGAAGSPAPSWIHITPAAPGTFYWSGTKTLIFAPDPHTPLPFATTFTVRVEASARAVSGKSLGAPYELTFTTPRARLLRVDWYRKNGRFDDSAVLLLQFNQPVKAEEVAARARVALTPHAWQAPRLSADALERWRKVDPAGFEQYERKLDSIRRVASSSAAIDVRLAQSWNEARFPRAPERVVLETTTAPPTDGLLTLGGWSRPGSESDGDRLRVQLEPTFLVSNATCLGLCSAAWYSNVSFTREVRMETFARSLTIADVTNAANETPLIASKELDPDSQDHFTAYPNIQNAGFPVQPPASTWRLRIAASLEARDGQTLGYPWTGVIEQMHAEAVIAFEGSVWERANGPRVPVVVRNVQSVRQAVAPVAPSAILARLQELMFREPRPLSDARAIRRLQVMPDAAQVHELDVRSLLGARGSGLIWAAVDPVQLLPRHESPTREAYEVVTPSRGMDDRRALIQVTNLGITVKDSPQNTLVFVTQLDSAAPVAGARVAIVDGNRRTVWRGTTDADGVTIAPSLKLPRTPSSPQLAFIVTAQTADDFAFVASNWTGDAHPSAWDINYDPTESAGRLRGAVFTDRGVYKPDEDVHVKAVLRTDTPGGMRLLTTGVQLDAVIQNNRGQEVDRRKVVLNGLSSVEWTWRVPPDAALGHYVLRLSLPDAGRPSPESIGTTLLVANYRRPDFRVDTTLDATQPVRGLPLRARVHAKYLFGGSLAGRPVRWRTTSKPVNRPPPSVQDRYPEDRYVIGSSRDAHPPAAEDSTSGGTAVLGADGTFTTELPTTAERDFAHEYQLDAEVADVSGQRIADRSSTVIHPASLYVAVSRPPVFVDANSSTALRILAVDLAGRPVRDVTINVSLLREQWRSSGIDRWGHPDWQRTEIPAGEWIVRTTETDVQLPIAIPQGGSYVLRATAMDADGRRTRTEVSFYAFGSGAASWRSNGQRIDLTPERKTWKPGETARVLIQSPWQHARALLTIEREGIRNHRTFVINSTQDIVDIPITEADIPNIFVSVVLVKGRTDAERTAADADPGRPSYRVGYTELLIDSSSKQLKVDVSTDRSEYRPRGNATISVAVRFADGRPAESEVTLWGMDHGVLSLTDYKAPDLLKHIYVHKALQVTTEDNRLLMMRRRVGAIAARADDAAALQLQASMVLGEGGVPGGVAGGMLSQDSGAVRQDFRALAFWLGSGVTDAGGKLTTTVTLPDSLTTYRIFVIAADRTSHFGSGELEIRAAKPLTLLPALPRFLMKGDRASFGAVVTNSTAQGGSAQVTIESLDGAMLRIEGASTRSVAVAAGESIPVRFDGVAIGRGPGRVRISATLGSETDAFELPLTISEPRRLYTTAAYGETTGDIALERLTVPSGVRTDTGGLGIELASTALVGLGESARYLDMYPYLCAEQKASRILALVFAADLDGAFNLRGRTAAELRSDARLALRSLQTHQCGEGNFALWPGRCGGESAYLTAYVLHAMTAARKLKLDPDRTSVAMAIGYLERQLRTPAPPTQWWPVWAAAQAYIVKVLAEHGQTSVDHTNRLNELASFAERLPLFAASYLADAYAAANDKGPRYQEIVRRLTNAIRIDADRAHIEELDESVLGWLWTTNVRATAVVLEGLSRRGDEPSLLAPLARWLLAVRNNSRWGTTHENLTGLEAFVSYYRAVETEIPRMTASVAVGSSTIGTAEFRGRSTTARRIEIAMPELLQHLTSTSSPALSISRTGTGRLYYTARLQYEGPDPSDSADRGIRVERRYEKYSGDAEASSPAKAATTFDAGDLVRVTVTLTVRGEDRFMALTDPLPAGMEPIDGGFQTTAADLSRATSRMELQSDGWSWWKQGGFEYVEKYDDRVEAFATKLGAGRHEFAYLVRATTPGTFSAPGTRVEAMYAPEVEGRAAGGTVTIR
jgi:alpha-2-macroglobulin